MTTRTEGTSSTTLTTLINGLRAHLQDYRLAEPATVSLEPTIRRVSIQAGSGPNELDRLGELLLWVYTLDEVSAEWWHTPAGIFTSPSRAAASLVSVSGFTAACRLVAALVWCSSRQAHRKECLWTSCTRC